MSLRLVEAAEEAGPEALDGGVQWREREAPSMDEVARAKMGMIEETTVVEVNAWLTVVPEKRRRN